MDLPSAVVNDVLTLLSEDDFLILSERTEQDLALLLHADQFARFLILLLNASHGYRSELTSP